MTIKHILYSEPCPIFINLVVVYYQPSMTRALAVPYRVERHSQFSSRTLRMPDSADLGQVSAKLEDGVLRVHIPKKVEATAKQRRVAIE